MEQGKTLNAFVTIVLAGILFAGIWNKSHPRVPAAAGHARSASERFCRNCRSGVYTNQREYSWLSGLCFSGNK